MLNLLIWSKKNESKISNFKVFYYFNPDILLTAFNKTVNINGHHYDLHVVDTAGQDEYTIFPAEYSVDVNGYVLVYSIDSMHSFEVCKNIHEKLMDLVGIRKYEWRHHSLKILFLKLPYLLFSVPIILVGNKTDLQVDRRVTQEQGKNLAAEMKAAFLETSAKENQNVEDIFRRVIAQMESIEGGGGGGEEKKCTVMWFWNSSSGEKVFPEKDHHIFRNKFKYVFWPPLYSKL